MKGTLYLVNRAHPLPEEPAAEDLASVRSGQTEVRLHQRAKVMLDQLLAAVDGAGTIILTLRDGYRTGDIMEPGKTLVGCEEMGRKVIERL